MNKSLEYIKNRINNTPDSVEDMPTEGWDNSLIINPMEKYMQYTPSFKNCLVNDNEFSVKVSCNQGEFKLNIEYDNEAEFEYFTMESTTHDGTLLFLEDDIMELLHKPLQLKTLPKRVMDDVLNNPCNYNYKYIIGDVIVHRDFGRKSINGRDMRGETDLVVLPIKFEYSMKDED